MVVAALIIVGVAIIAEMCAVMRAPVGYQDETGFHIGAPYAEDEAG